MECDKEHFMGDSADFIKDAAGIGQHECICENEAFQICTGVSLYEGSKDIRWVYFGLKCDKCNLIGNFADWKSEFLGFKKFLSNS